MNVPITQSKAWQTLQEDLQETSFYEETKDYVYLAIEKHTPVGNYLYLPYGPAAKNEESFKRALASLTSLAKAKKAIFIRIEPQCPSAANILRQKAISISGTTLRIQKSRNLSPAETWVLDLASADDYQTLCPSRLLRYYRNREKQGLTIRTSKDPADIHYLLDLQKQLASEKGINTFSEKYLQTELRQSFATLYLMERASVASGEVHSRECRRRLPRHKGAEPREDGREEPRPENESSLTPPDEVLAAGLVFDDKTTRYNLQGAQSAEGKKLHATGILTIQLIKDAKEKGLKTFDFWGIAPDGAPEDHPWQGFTAFKKTFAGTEKQYQGTHDLILSPARYKLYSLLRRLRR